MVLDDKRVRIITGHYGSGKTEFAVNYASMLVGLSDHKVALADMDIVNVYFRSREIRDKLLDKGIRVIDSSVNATADLPAIPAAAYAPFQDKSYEYVIDLGGNDVGTTVLGRYKEIIKPEETDFFMVVNVYRPDTKDVASILKQKEQLEYSSGLSVTGFVNNSNLVRETTAESILLGDEIVSEASRISGVPIKYTTYVEEVVLDMTPEIKAKLSGDVIPMKYFMRESWM